MILWTISSYARAVGMVGRSRNKVWSKFEKPWTIGFCRMFVLQVDYCDHEMEIMITRNQKLAGHHDHDVTNLNAGKDSSQVDFLAQKHHAL